MVEWMFAASGYDYCYGLVKTHGYSPFPPQYCIVYAVVVFQFRCKNGIIVIKELLVSFEFLHGFRNNRLTLCQILPVYNMVVPRVQQNLSCVWRRKIVLLE